MKLKVKVVHKPKPDILKNAIGTALVHLRNQLEQISLSKSQNINSEFFNN